jgi:hypothetical protein
MSSNIQRPERTLIAACLSVAALVISSMAQATSWSSVRSTVATRGIAGNGHIYVAAATNGIWTSDDLKSWTRVTLPTSAGVYYDDVIWDGSRFLAGGFGIVSSTDGKSWTTVYKPSGTLLHGISLMGGVYVAAGDDNLILRSTDGKSWHKVSSGLVQASGHQVSVTGISNDGGQFVASAEDFALSGVILNPTADYILTSPDGVTWASQTMTSGGFMGVTGNGMAVGGGAYFAGGFIAGYTSPDASTWTLDDISGVLADSNQPNWIFNRAAYLNGQFMAIGFDGSNTSNSSKMAVFKSNDGINWTSHDLEDRGATISGMSGLTYSNGTYVAAGYQGVYSSTDASHWTKQFTGPQTRLWQCVIIGGGRDIAMGSGGQVSAAVGADWPDTLTLLSQSPSQGRGCGAYGAGVYVMAGNELMWSTDGKSWAAATVNGGFSPFRAYSVAWTGSKFVALYEDGTGLSSADGKTWSHVSSSLPAGTIDLNRGGFSTGAMIAAGSALVAWGTLDGEPLIMTSTDGANWNEATLHNVSATDVIVSVAYSGSGYAAIGNTADGSTLILTSSDGKDWQGVSSTMSGVTWDAITWGDNEYVAAGLDSDSERAAILTSSDGGNQWTLSRLTETSIVNDIAWDGSAYIVAGSYDIVRGTPGGSGGTTGGGSGGKGGGASGSGGGGAFGFGLLGLLMGFAALRRRSHA